MNSNKYDYYNVAKYFLFASAVAFLAGLIVLCVFGFNVSGSQSEHLVFQSVLSIVVSLVLIFVYIGLRHDWAKALSAVIVAATNVLLSTAIICITRISVAETIVMAYVLLVGLSAIFSLILQSKVGKINDKNADKHSVIQKALNESFYLIRVFSLVVLSVMIFCLLFKSTAMFDFARELFIMMVVLIMSVYFYVLPVYVFQSLRLFFFVCSFSSLYQA